MLSPVFVRVGPLPAPGGASGALPAVRGREKGPDWPGLQTKEEKMESLKPTFTRAATGNTGISIFSLLLLAIAIDDDRQRREKEQLEKRVTTRPCRGIGPRWARTCP